MIQTQQRFSKYQIKQAIVDAMKAETDVHKIIIFGSFLRSETPNDIDVAVVGNFNQGYLDAALRLRQHVRHIAKILPVDIVPIQENAPPNSFVQDILDGEVIYEA
jgi:predicted nucleotidyltransferase